MTRPTRLTRRQFFTASAAAMAAGGCATDKGGAKVEPGLPANAVRIGLIGCGLRGTELAGCLLTADRRSSPARIVAVHDIYAPRAQAAQTRTGAAACERWEEVVARRDVEGVVIAAPPHWHAPMAIAAMEAGKHVYCETPMAHTVDEARAMAECALRSGRALQIGAQDVSDERWRRACEAVQSGAAGKIRWGHAGPLRAVEYDDWHALPVPAGAGPGSVDWKAFTGKTDTAGFDAQRVFQWPKFWDYSLGVAGEIHYGLLAPLLGAMGAACGELPERVSAAGGICVHDGRETPDSLMASLEYPGGCTLSVAASLGPRTWLPPVIQGTRASIDFAGGAAAVIPAAEAARAPAPPRKRPALPDAATGRHMDDWLGAIREGRPCACGPELGLRTMVAVAMSVEAYRRGETVALGPDGRTVVKAPSRLAIPA